MKQPIRITVDPLCSLGYIEYREPSDRDGYRDVVREVDGHVQEYSGEDDFGPDCASVMVWFDADDEIVAFEIICIDDPLEVALARDYARDNDLAFPSDIRAAAARDPAA
jgi:hypothetical protein